MPALTAGQRLPVAGRALAFCRSRTRRPAGTLPRGQGIRAAVPDPARNCKPPLRL